jgi:hypothetical protein
VQTCVIHSIRNTLWLASKRDWDALKGDVKPVCTAVTAEGDLPRQDCLYDPAQRPDTQFPPPPGTHPIR